MIGNLSGADVFQWHFLSSILVAYIASSTVWFGSMRSRAEAAKGIELRVMFHGVSKRHVASILVLLVSGKALTLSTLTNVAPS